VSRRLKPVLLAVGCLVVVAVTTAVGLSLRDDPRLSPIDRDARATERAADAPPQVLVVRRRGGVPPSWAKRLRRTAGVMAVARTTRTQALLRRSRRAGGRTVDAVPQGYAIPLDALVVQPQAFGDVLPQTGRAIRRLRSHTALLSRTSARLRRLGVGDRLSVAGGRELRVAGVVDDELAGFAELVLTGRDGGDGNDATRQLLVATTRPEMVERKLARNDAVRIRPLSPTLRTSPRLVALPLETKARFGEFAVGLPYRSDWIRIEPRWLDRNIVTRSVPILGAVTCNRRLFAPLRRALRTLERRGLSSVVDRADYAGCFAPRRIPGSGSLSLHAWGLAIDINAAANPRLGDSRQDRRLVRAMEDAGFTWGGRWPTVPDPMHFELHP
jgi:D-alanyl-D-alanine carboxypeptidase-like protein